MKDLKIIPTFSLLLLLGCLLCQSNNLTITYDGVKESFIEDHSITFKCCLPKPVDGVLLTWRLMQETVSRERFLLHYKLPVALMSEEYGYKMQDASGCRRTKFTIRRDFDNSSLRCEADNGMEANFIFPNITKTIRITDVRLLTKVVGFGTPIQFICEAKTKMKLKEMYIRLDREYFRMNMSESSSENDDPTSYNGLYKKKGKFAMSANGIPIQCVAVTENLNSNVGNVFSTIDTLVVEYMMLVQHSYDVTATNDGSCIMKFRIRAHPEPEKHNFHIYPQEQIEETKVEIMSLSGQKKQVDKYKDYEVTVTFIPIQTGSYELQFRGKILSGKYYKLIVMKLLYCKTNWILWLLFAMALGVIALIIIALGVFLNRFRIYNILLRIKKRTSHPHHAIPLEVHDSDECEPWDDFEFIRDKKVADADKNITHLHANMLDDSVTVEHLQVVSSEIDAKTKIGSTALYLAARGGNLEKVQWLLLHRAKHLPRNDGSTALHVAARLGWTNIIQALLEDDNCGVDKDVKDKENETPLLLALDNEHWESAKLLIENGCDVTARRRDGSTALHVVAAKGCIPIADLLIRKGCNFSPTQQFRRNDGATPMYVAADYGNTTMVSFLMQKGCNKKMKTKDGFTAWDTATKQNFTSIEDILR